MEILKNPLVAQSTLSNHYIIDGWEFFRATSLEGRGGIEEEREILKSPLAAELTMKNQCEIDFWGIVPAVSLEGGGGMEEDVVAALKHSQKSVLRPFLLFNVAASRGIFLWEFFPGEEVWAYVRTFYERTIPYSRIHTTMRARYHRIHR